MRKGALEPTDDVAGAGVEVDVLEEVGEAVLEDVVEGDADVEAVEVGLVPGATGVMVSVAGVVLEEVPTASGAAVVPVVRPVLGVLVEALSGVMGVTPEVASEVPPVVEVLGVTLEPGDEVDGAGLLALGGVLGPPVERNEPPLSKVAMIPAMTAKSARPMRRSGQLRRIQSMPPSLL